jgi:hypothetical protein
LFDVAMFATPPQALSRILGPNVFPAVPLLAQAWPLLDAYGVRLPDPLSESRGHVTDSLWTLFDRRGIPFVRMALESGEIQ